MKPKYNETVIHDERITLNEKLDTMWARMGPKVCPKLWAQVVKEQSKAAYRKKS